MVGRIPVERVVYAEGSTRSLLADLDKRVAHALAYLDERAHADAADEAVEWLLHLRISRGLSVQTIETYAKCVTRFFVWMHDSKLEIDQVTLQCLEDWQKWMYVARHFGEQFRKQHIAALRQFFAWRERFLNKPNPSKFMRGPKVTKKTPRKFSTTDLQKLFATCDTSTTAGIRDYAMLLFFYATGARKEEAQQLDISHLTLRERTGKVKFFGKGAKEREVGFQGEAVEAMRRWLTVRDTLELANKNAVWIGLRGQNQFGERITTRAIEHMLKRHIKRCGITACGIHSLRVTFATDLYDEGIDIAIIQQLLGHEKIETTRRYIVVSERKLNTKMPTSRINHVTGSANNELPRWAQKKQQQRATQFND